MTTMLEQDVVTSRDTARGLPGSVGKADAVRVLLFDGDPIHREALTDELSKQGFVIRSFGDSGALLGAVRDAVDVDVIVVLPKESSLDLLIKLQRQGVTVPVDIPGRPVTPGPGRQQVARLGGAGQAPQERGAGERGQVLRADGPGAARRIRDLRPAASAFG